MEASDCGPQFAYYVRDDQGVIHKLDIDDETLASMKGFNELSFRTDSPGKKRRRRAKRKGKEDA